jgi:hypothetical protein
LDIHSATLKNKLITAQKIQITALESNAVADAEFRTKVVVSYQELVEKYSQAVHDLKDLTAANEDYDAASRRCIQSAIRLGATAGVGEGRAWPQESYDAAVEGAIETVNNELRKRGITYPR